MKIFTRILFLTVTLCCWGIVGYGQSSVIISQYIETNSGTTPKGIEILNVSGSDITFSVMNNLQVYQGTNGGSCTAISSINVTSGTLKANEVWVIGTSNLTAFANTNGTSLSGTTSYAFSFNGDDALQVRLGGVVQDVFGVCGSDPGSSWSGGGVSTADNNLEIKNNTCDGDTGGFTNPSIRFNQIANGSTMTGFGSISYSCTSSNDPEPTNHPTNFIAATGTPPTSVIDMVWDDAVGAQLPAGYLIKANTTGTFADPVDGTDPAEDTDLSDGEALVKVSQGTEFYSFSGLDGSTQYYFKIWPYTNAGATIDFKTDGTPLEDNATTEAECGITVLGSASISCDSNTDGNDNDFVTISLPYTGVDASAILTIITGGSSEPNTGNDPTAFTDGTISFAALEGDAWSVTITGGNCNLSQSGTVPSSECNPPSVIVINELLADPDSDVNGDGVTDAEDDEFVEIYNSGASAIDISGWTIEDAIGTRHIFPASTIVQPDEGIVVFGGGSPTGIPSLVQTASTGALGINNGGDDIYLYDNSSSLIDSYSFSSSSNDVSYARSPDYSGSFVLHTAVPGNPVNYSPGRFNVDNTAFPVAITFFSGRIAGKNITTSWQTATEENNSHFLIQRSIDGGKTFETIGQIEGMGNSASPVDYEYVDTKPAAGMNYYRLQQFDFDGTNEFFGPVAVRFSGEVTDAPVIWPVPARERLQVTLPASDNDWLLEVFDLNGRRLLQQTTEEKGLDTYFDLNALPAGSYLLRWNNGRQSGQERFLKG